MGGVCSRRSAVDKSPSESTLQAHDLRDRGMPARQHLVAVATEADYEMERPQVMASVEKHKLELEVPFSVSEAMIPALANISDDVAEPNEPRLIRVLSQKSRTAKLKSGATKVSEMSSKIGRAGTVGFVKAVEVLDTLGSSMTNLNISSGFVSGTKGDKISILAFEVANTIVKGSNLMQSLSKENIKHLKEVVLLSEGVQRLISKDVHELMRIAAADKREEMKVFVGEVVRFGNRCKDPQWHHLDRYFENLGTELTLRKQLKEEAETTIRQLTTLVQYTAVMDELTPYESHPLYSVTNFSFFSTVLTEMRKTCQCILSCLQELYHESNILDRLEQDYRRKYQEDENSTSSQRGDNLQILRQELKSQKKHVKNLKKKSLWSRILEEIMEKLVDIVHFLHLEIHEAFGEADCVEPLEESVNVIYHQRLGPAGLSLHYANIITQIDNLVSRSTSVPPNLRDTLYQGLPPSIKVALRTQLQLFELGEELTVPYIKTEMEKTLRWLLPIANNTTKAHHGFGWVGEWANTGSEMNRNQTGHADILRIETLHHAVRGRTDDYILDLIVWLHHLISLSKAANGCTRSVKSPLHSPSQVSHAPENKSNMPNSHLTQEDREMLRVVTARRLTPGISRSQEFDRVSSWTSKDNRLSKSSSHSPRSGYEKEVLPIRRLPLPRMVDFDIDWNKALDVIDRVETLRTSSGGRAS